MNAVTEAFEYVSVENLSPGQYQPRHTFEPNALAELADSIKAQGIIEPLIIRPLNETGYEIIAGERRWRAAQLAGLSKVPCLIRFYSDEQAAEISLIENLQRTDLNPIESAYALERLMTEFNYTHEMLGKALGISRTKVTNTLRLLQLDERVKDYLITQALTEGHGKMLVGLPQANQFQWALQCIKNGWSVRTLENQLQHNKSGSQTTNTDDPNIKRLEQILTDQLGTETKLEFEADKQRGWLRIRYQNQEILSGILEKLDVEFE